MSLTEIFNNGYEALKDNDWVLCIRLLPTGRFSTPVETQYDFGQRHVATYFNGNGTGVMPFALVDREILTVARDKLIELGGHPPELPTENPAVVKLKSALQL